MYPILLRWGDFLLPSWHVFYVIGALSSYGLLLLLGKKVACGIRTEDLSQIFVVCYVSGYFGARLLSIVIEEPHIVGFWDTMSALFRFGPMTFYGGAIAAFLAGSLFSLHRKISYGEMADLGVVAGLLALSIGRVGCFLNGDDYGKPLSVINRDIFSSLGVIFPVLEDGIVRWPVQLFEAGAVFLLVSVMAWVKVHGKSRPGMTALLCIILYANLRFCLEFLRDDFRGFVFGTWLSTSQFIAVITLAMAGFIALIWLPNSKADQ